MAATNAAVAGEHARSEDGDLVFVQEHGADCGTVLLDHLRGELGQEIITFKDYGVVERDVLADDDAQAVAGAAAHAFVRYRQLRCCVGGPDFVAFEEPEQGFKLAAAGVLKGEADVVRLQVLDAELLREFRRSVRLTGAGATAEQ
jgi:hypothetical protein